MTSASATAPGAIARWVSAEQVADRTPFEAVTIRRACSRGEIPGAVKKCGRWCIPEGAELIWLQRETPAAPQQRSEAAPRVLKHGGPCFQELVEVEDER